MLADQTELFNGYATPVPYNTIVLYAVSPSGSSSDFDDWLRLVFTHEFTHIVHLDRSEGWARIARDIFGRTPYAFPNLFLPPWQIEGLATYEESAITGEGRLHAGDFRAIVGEAARQRRLEPLDRVNGGLTDWPGGAGVYAYGVGFHQYLADRFGADTLATLADGDGAPRAVYRLACVQAGLRPVARRPVARLPGEPRPQTLAAACAGPVHHPADASGFLGQRSALRSLFVRRLPRRHRVLRGQPGRLSRRSIASASTAAQPRQLTTRYLGSTTGIGRDEIYFDQLELRRNVGLYSDLYAFSRADGRVRQLTSDARAARSGSVARRRRRSSACRIARASGISCWSG